MPSSRAASSYFLRRPDSDAQPATDIPAQLAGKKENFHRGPGGIRSSVTRYPGGKTICEGSDAPSVGEEASARGRGCSLEAQKYALLAAVCLEASPAVVWRAFERTLTIFDIFFSGEFEVEKLWTDASEGPDPTAERAPPEMDLGF